MYALFPRSCRSPPVISIMRSNVWSISTISANIARWAMTELRTLSSNCAVLCCSSRIPCCISAVPQSSCCRIVQSLLCDKIGVDGRGHACGCCLELKSLPERRGISRVVLVRRGCDVCNGEANAKMHASFMDIYKRGYLQVMSKRAQARWPYHFSIRTLRARRPQIQVLPRHRYVWVCGMRQMLFLICLLNDEY